MQFFALCVKEGAKIHLPLCLLCSNLPGEVFSGGRGSGERNGLGEKINIPFVLLVNTCC